MSDKKKIIGIMAISLLLYLVVYSLNKLSKIKEKRTHFIGRIDKLEFSDKKTLTVTINGNKYGLGTGWRFNEKIAVGDSLIKDSDRLSYRLIKLKTKEVINSDSL
ncbi:hypothetical protein [Mucilaginibacter sp.]|uniref:hypothetical protein n=1 Tax=Mucilaginibacter sp. TaxID=1882438 RepID=UPI002ED586D8